MTIDGTDKPIVNKHSLRLSPEPSRGLHGLLSSDASASWRRHIARKARSWSGMRWPHDIIPRDVCRSTPRVCSSDSKILLPPLIARRAFARHTLCAASRWCLCTGRAGACCRSALKAPWFGRTSQESSAEPCSRWRSRTGRSTWECFQVVTPTLDCRQENPPKHRYDRRPIDLECELFF